MKQSMSRTLAKRAAEVMIAALLYSAALSGTLETMAAVSGSGSVTDPVTGIAEPGDEIPADVYVINLTETDGARIYMSGRYEPKEYAVIFDAAGGSFPDGTGTQEIMETYDAQVHLPGEPLRPGCVFTAWYLKGNRKPAEPSEADGVLLTEGTGFQLAADDEEDMAGPKQTLWEDLWRGHCGGKTRSPQMEKTWRMILRLLPWKTSGIRHIQTIMSSNGSRNFPKKQTTEKNTACCIISTEAYF